MCLLSCLLWFSAKFILTFELNKFREKIFAVKSLFDCKMWMKSGLKLLSRLDQYRKLTSMQIQVKADYNNNCSCIFIKIFLSKWRFFFGVNVFGGVCKLIPGFSFLDDAFKLNLIILFLCNFTREIWIS